MKIFFRITGRLNNIDKRYKLALAIFFLVVAVFTVGKIIHMYIEDKKTLTIAVMADIHAGNQDVREQGIEENNILYPVNFEKNFKAVLPRMKKFDYILTLGDNLNSSSKKYAGKLLDLTKGYPMIWTKGNHENDETFKLFHQPRNYYYIDEGGWRIIILDNGNIDHSVDYEKGAYIPRGYMEPEQVEWLKNNALKTDKKIIIAMHVPIFDRFNMDMVYPNQQYLVRMFEENGNVKYVLAGHFHSYNFYKETNGIKYYILPSFSLKGGEGYFMTLELDN